MWQKFLAVVGLTISGLVLIVSVFRSADQAAYADEVTNQLDKPALGTIKIQDIQLTDFEIGQTVVRAAELFSDRVEVWFATDGAEKAVVYSELAEERMNRVDELVSLGEYEQAMKTAAKGTRYLQLAQQESTAAGSISVYEELVETSFLHEQVLTNMGSVEELASLPMKQRLLNEVLLLRSQVEQLLAEVSDAD